MTQAVYTPSQEASAASHLDRQGEWRFYRVDGVRYVALQSGNSGRVYHVRASADGCSCLFYERTGRTCSHMLAVERSAMLEELVEQPARRPSYADLFPKCRTCSDLVDRAGESCYACASNEARRLDDARRRETVGV